MNKKEILKIIQYIQNKNDLIQVLLINKKYKQSIEEISINPILNELYINNDITIYEFILKFFKSLKQLQIPYSYYQLFLKSKENIQFELKILKSNDKMLE